MIDPWQINFLCGSKQTQGLRLIRTQIQELEATPDILTIIYQSLAPNIYYTKNLHLHGLSLSIICNRCLLDEESNPCIP